MEAVKAETNTLVAVKAKTVLAAVGAKMTVVAVMEMSAVVAVKEKAAVAVKAKTAAGRCVCSLFLHTHPLLRMKMRRTCFGASSPW